MSKLTHIADKTIEHLFYTLFFFVPLILWPRTSEVFEFNKMLAVYAITILILASWFVKWLATGKISMRRTPLDLPIFLFLVSQILSTIFSIDTHTSLWGYYSRFHGGLISTLTYIILYYALVTNFNPPKVRFLVYAVLGSATLVSLYGVLEHLGIDRHLWVQDVQNRVFSTIGQPNWLSAYLVALLPLPIFFTINEKNLNYRLLWILLAALFCLTIYFTKSQSGLFATGLTLAAIAAYLVGQKFRFSYWLIPLLFTAVVTTRLDLVLKINPFTYPNLDKLVEADRASRHAGSDSMIIRQVVWEGARRLGLANPLFGTGLETFGYTYFTVRPALHNLLSEWEFLYNKAHNEYLNIFANTGFVGLFSYLLLIGLTLYILARQSGPLSHALFFGYLSVLITNYFGFSVVPVALFFFLFPALAFILSKSKEAHRTLNFNINHYLGLTLLLPITFYFLAILLRQWRADIAMNTSRQYLSLSAYKQSLDYAKIAVDLYPSEPLFYAQLSESQAAAATAVKAQLDELPATASADLAKGGQTLLTDLETASLANANRAVAMNPHHTNFYKSKAKVELYLGTINPEYNRQALQTLLDLSTISPTDAKTIMNIGLIYDQLGEKENAQAAYKKALNLKPDYDAARAQLDTK